MGDLLDILIGVGVWGGLAIVFLGKLFIGKRDGRTKTGWRNNRKPRWLPGIFCYILGAIWFSAAFLTELQI